VLIPHFDGLLLMSLNLPKQPVEIIDWQRSPNRLVGHIDLGSHRRRPSVKRAKQSVSVKRLEKCLSILLLKRLLRCHQRLQHLRQKLPF